MTGPPPHATRERLAWLSLLPVIATGLYYLVPAPAKDVIPVQFIPQILAYLGFAVWARFNHGTLDRVGLAPAAALFRQGLPRGVATGLVLGGINLSLILWLLPALGADICFLRTTPHARLPAPVMLPWFIVFIACAVELNFRGFILGRLLALFAGGFQKRYTTIQAGWAIAISALTFSYDPFMVATFRHLHWIAVWDGIIWGFLLVRFRNLYIPIVAHAVEVIVMYSVLKSVLQ
jgi:hypothetical protein